MALGGGTFLVQNKILPGAYINFVSKARALGSLGERGTVAMLLQLSWGQEDEVFSVTAEDFQKNALAIFGYSYTDSELLFIREVFKGANTLLCYRPKSGEKAKAVIDNLSVTAKHGGIRGNDIKIVIENNIDNEELYDVYTYIGNDNILIDQQTVSLISELMENDYVTFQGTGSLSETAGTSLSGGTDREITGNDYSNFLDKVEAEEFTTLLYAGEDLITKSLFDSFTKRLRDDEGYKITTVLHDYTKADFEGVISVKNTTTHTNKAALVYWVAGRTAGANINETLTNFVYDGELEINTKFKKSEFTKAIQNGEFALYGEKDKVKVLKDINTFTSIEPNKNADFSNNQIIRVLDEIGNGVARIFDSFYLGKVQNSPSGRDLFKVELINYHEQLQSIDALTNFKADDIIISKGREKGDVVVEEAVEPVGAMDKLYMSVTVI